MYVNDFDENGTVEQIVCCYNGDKQYPVALRHDLLAVIPSLKKKFLKYSDYQRKDHGGYFQSRRLVKYFEAERA